MKRMLAFTLTAMLMLSAISLLNNDVKGDEVKSGESVDIRLYFHDDRSMDTNYNDALNDVVLNDVGDNVTFSTEELDKKLEMRPYKLSGDKWGFKGWLTFEITDPLASGDSVFDIRVYDDDKLIAEATYSFSDGRTNKDLEIPFTDEYDRYDENHPYTFSIDSIIYFEVELRGEGSYNMRNAITSASSSDPAYLSFEADKVEADADTYDSEGAKEDEFGPKAPEDMRVIFINGTIDDAFGGGDVIEVKVTIAKDSEPDKPIANDTAEFDEDKMEYGFRYNYSTSISPGPYTAKVYIYTYYKNNEDHIFTTETHFEITTTSVVVRKWPSEDLDRDTDVIDLVISEGSEEQFHSDVTNAGTEDIDFIIEYSISGGWILDVEDSKGNDIDNGDKISIKSGETETLTGTITPPVGAQPGDKADGWLKATAEGSESSDKIEFIIEVTESYEIDLELKGDYDGDDVLDVPEEITGGGEKEFNITVYNKGAYHDKFRFNIDVPSGWSVEPDPIPSIELDPGEKYEFDVTVRAPYNQIKGEEYEVKIEGISEGAEGLEPFPPKGKDDVTIRLKWIEELDIRWDPSDLVDADVENSDDTARFEATFDNTGDEELEISLSYSDYPPGWKIEFSKNEFNLTPDEVKTIIIDATVPEGEDAGLYSFIVRIEWGENQREKSLSVNVLPYYKIELVNGDKEKRMMPDEADTFTITVRNLGNANDTIMITKSGKNSNWIKIEGKDDKLITVKPGKEEKIEISIKIPSDAKQGDKAEIIIKATSTGDEKETKEIALDIEIEQELNEQIIQTIQSMWYFLVLLIIVVVIFFWVKSKRAG